MTKHTRSTPAAALATVLVLGLTACSTSEPSGTTALEHNPGAVGVIGGIPKRGGTLTIQSSQDFTHLDPARNWVMPAMDFGTRLLYRTLTTFKAKPGKEGTEIVPDLAVDLGKPSHGGTVWTFTLKEGLQYEDGSPIRAQDIKYNVERSFSPALTGGPDYARRYLADSKDYSGPLEGEHLSSIETPNDRTIVFHLNRPVAEFSYIATLPTFSPVPEQKDRGARYDLRPFSSGPYKIAKYARGEKLVLVRNTYWDPHTDPVRKAYPDKIVVEMVRDGEQIDDLLIASEGDDASSVQWSGMQPESVTAVLGKEKVTSRLSAQITGCTDMLHLNTSRPPFDNPTVRKAMQYAVDRTAQVKANGGSALNEIATSYLPSTLTQGHTYNVLNVPPEGDPDKAQELLAEAGKGNGLTVHLSIPTGDLAQAQALKKDLDTVGIQVRIQMEDPSNYYDVIGNTKEAPEMVIGGWCPDYPSGSTFIPFVFDGRAIKEEGNQGNFSQFRDKEVMKRIDEITALTDLTKANQAWVELDKKIMQKAPAIPLLWERKPLLVGENIAGAFGHPVWSGQLDYAVIGLKDPARSTNSLKN